MLEEEAKQKWAPKLESAKAQAMAETDQAEKKRLQKEYSKLKKKRNTDVSAKWDQACAGAKASKVFSAVRKKMRS